MGTELNTLTAFQELLSLILKTENRLLKQLEDELQNAPPGSLSFWRTDGVNGKVYFSNKYNGKSKGITGSPDLIYKLARKRYLSIVVSEMRQDCASYTSIYEKTAKSKKKRSIKTSAEILTYLLKEYAEAGLDISRITLTPEQYRWMHASYASNSINPDELIYETYSGIRVRSKSERTIGNRLELYGFPYRYEQPVTVNTLWMNDEYGCALPVSKTYYPDFTIMLPNGEIILWEHLGRADIAEYRRHTMEKISAYRQSDIVDSRHLILTFEKDLEKPETLDEIIKINILMLLGK